VGRLTQTSYRDWPAYRLESERMSVIVLPELGGKIVSLLYKPTGKEWLIDSGPRPLAKVPYGSDYGRADLSGWDECFPTIVACGYPGEGAYYGRPMPDHGELWSVPWRMEASGSGLIGEVDGIALPYRFKRALAFKDDSTLRMSYSAANAGEEPLFVFWTAHPLFAATEQTRIVLPEGMKKLLCVDGGKAFRQGESYAWPQGDGARALDRIGPPFALDSRKFYAENGLTDGWAMLREADTGEFVSLSWSAAELPYFGFWVDEGEHTGCSVCALEPCNGYYDSLTEAFRQGKLLRIAPGETVEWGLEVRAGNGED